jgi:hypothetical protein
MSNILTLWIKCRFTKQVLYPSNFHFVRYQVVLVQCSFTLLSMAPGAIHVLVLQSSKLIIPYSTLSAIFALAGP